MPSCAAARNGQAGEAAHGRRLGGKGLLDAPREVAKGATITPRL